MCLSISKDGKDEAERKYGNELPDPITNEPKEWLFSGRPKLSGASLHVAVARLVGYKLASSMWRRFLSLFVLGWQIHSRNTPIQMASSAYLPLRASSPADEKLNGLLAADFGSDWSATRLSSLLAEAGCSGKSLDDWLRDSFFVQHCELFCQRPFVWHVWDGRRDGFNALVNYHRLAAPWRRRGVERSKNSSTPILVIGSTAKELTRKLTLRVPTAAWQPRNIYEPSSP